MTTTTSTTTSTSTTQPPYTDDTDLLTLRPNIASLGVTEWTTTHERARDVINQDLEAGWYRQACVVKGVNPLSSPFTPSLMLNAEDQLRDLSLFKVLELAYEYLAKDAMQDNFMELSDRYRKKYRDELKRVVTIGIHYDWDADFEIDDSERYYQREGRRISRC